MKTHSLFSRRAVLVGAGVALIALALVLGWLAASRPAANKAGDPSTATPVRSGRPTVPSAGPVETGDDKPASPAAGLVRPVAADIERIAVQLRRVAGDPALGAAERQAAARRLLAELRQALRSAEPDAVAFAILAYLESGDDVLTGLGFTIEAGGILADAPSLRTALLDLLGQFDPVAAADYAGRIFENSRIPEEWALALRGLGWQNHDGSRNDEIRRHFHALLAHDDWVRQPGEGFLHAFDTAVHLGGVPELEEMIRLVLPVDADNRPVENGLTHAAYLALDRMTVLNPLQTLEILARDPESLAWAPEHRASLVARADVSRPDQRALVETYLATLAERPRELETFTELFPNRNGSLGHNLITTPTQANGPHPRELDAAALDVVREWLDRGAYPAIAPNLRWIEVRLAGFLGGT